MLFNSYSFILIFLPITFFGIFWLGNYSHRMGALWLAFASLTFYAVWDPRFLLVLLGSIVFNYGAGYLIGVNRAFEENKKAKQYLVFSVAANLALLFYFKYTNFFISSVNQLLGSQIAALNVTLAIGISFFTFTQIAFLVDVYRGMAREYSFIHYLLFVTWFPHLIAGPILHHKQMMPQFASAGTYSINMENIAVGLAIFVVGLSKKVLIADNLAEYANPVFTAASQGHTPMFFEAWIGALAYTLQLYFDFSGYSDMAIGLSLMFNVRLPLNFDSPYKATNIIDFWRRWHMTLSAFLRDYLYIPLGGSRRGGTRHYINLMATMLLGGLWHGAGWTFVIWGGLHGLYLIINHVWRDLKSRLGWEAGGVFARLGAGALTFHAVVIAWVFFRADSFASAQSIIAGMIGLNGISEPALLKNAILSFATISFGLAIALLFPNVRQLMCNYKPTWDDLRVNENQKCNGVVSKLALSSVSAILCAIILIACLFKIMSSPSPFLYFQF